MRNRRGARAGRLALATLLASTGLAMAGPATTCSGAPAPTAPSFGSEDDSDDLEPRSLWFQADPDAAATSRAVAFSGLMTPRFPSQEATEVADTKLTLRADPVEGHGSATFVGDHAGSIKALHVDLYRGTPEQELPVERLGLRIEIDGVVLIDRDVEVFFVGDPVMNACHLSNPWYETRVIDVDRAMESAGLDSAATAEHRLVVTLAMPSDAPAGSTELVGIGQHDHASRLLVNPEFSNEATPRTSATGSRD